MGRDYSLKRNKNGGGLGRLPGWSTRCSQAMKSGLDAGTSAAVGRELLFA
jgi:hypothetical protein